MAGITPIASQREKRIALFTGAFNHVVDGVSLTLNRLVSHLESEGTPVHVFAPTVENPPIKHSGVLTGVPSIKMPGRPEYRISVGMNPAAVEELDRFKPTIVHIATPDLVGLQALLYARVQKIPVVASYHTHFSSYLGFYDLDRFEAAMWRYLRWFYARCEHLYVPSLSMVSVLKEHGIQKGIELWPRGVDIVAFSPEKRSMEWRRELGFTDDMVVIAYISRLVIEKGLDVFADVVRRLLDDGLNVRSLIVGEGPAGAMLKEKLPEAVFLGHLQGDELSVAYASSDLFLFPSETETFGNVTLEAMASGVPTLCADATGSNSLVLHDRTGFLSKGRDIESFAHYAKSLTLDTSRRLQMGSAARAEAETYSWRRILGKIDSFYDQILQLPERD
jgi:glycosyltransferase involved in cell wall biosynthesis